jgi:hypothetical protein
MKMKDIEVGAEYAFSVSSYAPKRRVTVLETGLPEGNWSTAKKSRVRIEVLDEPAERYYSSIKKGALMTVESRQIRSTWADAEEEVIRKAERAARAEEEKRASEALAEEYRTALRNAGFKVAVKHWSSDDDIVTVKPSRIGEPTVIFQGTEALELSKRL